MVPKSAWHKHDTLKVAVDLNAAPAARHRGHRGERRRRRCATGSRCFGAFGVGNFKTKLHKACVTRLFTRNDLVLDAEAIADVARELLAGSKA